MSTKLNIEKRKHSSLLSKFERKIEDCYFETQTNLDNSDAAASLNALFYRLTSLIVDFQRADEKHKQIFKNQIETLTVDTPQIRNCYKVINGKKQDLATFALEIGSAKWAAYMINGEHTDDRLARERYEEEQRRFGERDIFEEDASPSFPKTEKQKELLFLMYAGKGYSFLPDNEIIQMFTKKLEISPHRAIGIKVDNNEFYQTTPFMYFLQKNYYSDKKLAVPPYSGSHFYTDAKSDFKNFDGDTLKECFLKADLLNLYVDYSMHNMPETKTPVVQQQPQKNQEDDLFSMQYQQEKQTIKAALFKAQTPKPHSDTLFDLDELEPPAPEKTQPVKPTPVAHHKKVDETPDLPFLDFQRD